MSSNPSHQANRIYVSSGHGADERGTVVDDLVERDLNAAVTSRLVERLRAHDLDVATDLEHGNPTFPAEVHLARSLGDIRYYLSLHHNGFHDPDVRGCEAFGLAGRASELARSLQESMLSALRTLDPTLPDRGVKDGAGTGAAKHLDAAPGVVVVLEPCFLTSPEDAALCRHPAYVEVLAEAICRELIDQGRVDGYWTATYRSGGITLPPVFSVVVPTHERPEMLEAAVQSVLEQRVTGLEVVVVDDASPTPVRRFADGRVQVVRLPEQRGPAGARNAGMEAARGRYLAFLDDDDLWVPQRLDFALAGLRRAPVALCWTRHLERPNGAHRVLEGRVGDALLEDTTPCLGATALRREVAPRFDERWSGIEDLVWWWELARAQPVATVPDVGYLVRLHEGVRGRNTLAVRVRENLALLEERQTFFAAHRAAAAHRWLRVGILATEAGDHGTAALAFARHLRLRPRMGAVAHLAAALARWSTAFLRRRR